MMQPPQAERDARGIGKNLHNCTSGTGGTCAMFGLASVNPAIAPRDAGLARCRRLWRLVQMGGGWAQV